MIKFHLAELLVARKMKQTDLQRKTGIRYATINNYYNGFAEKLNVKDIAKICTALGCSVGELIENIPVPEDLPKKKKEQ